MNILDTIVEQKRQELEHLPRRPAEAGHLKWTVKACGERRDFAGALRFPRRGKIALIAEIKKASPSAGVISPDFDPVRIARQYEAAGASALSVLTDEKFFQGSLEYLRRVRESVRLPLLRKDFIIDERQLLESIEWGADAVLLIAGILSDAQLQLYQRLCSSCGMAALVEVHDETELDRAINAGAQIIGINNRNLKTFSVDLGVTERLTGRLAAQGAAAGKIIVTESGIKTRADVELLARCGVHALLVGETLMKSASIDDKIQELVAG